MMNDRLFVIALLLLCTVALSACGPAKVNADLLIQNVTVYPGSGEGPFTADIAVRDGIFVAVDRELSGGFEASRKIDGDGKYLMPGLWEMHGHIADVDTQTLEPRKFLEHGITALRDAGGHVEQVRSIRDAMAGDASAGPSIYFVGATLNGEQFASFQWALTSVADVEPAIRSLVADGAVQIKIHRAISKNVFEEVLAIAHGMGLTVTGHIPLVIEPLEACEMGLDGIEHTGALLESYISTTDDADANIDSAIAYFLSDEATATFECLNRRKVFVTPTLVVYPAVAKSRGYDPLPPELQEQIRGLQEITKRLFDEGVPLLVGTDSATVGPMNIAPGSSYHEELAMLQDSGIPPGAIIRMATQNASIAVGAADVRGTIEPGKAADFLLLTADPGWDVGNIGKIEAIFRGGAQVGPSE